MEIKIKIRTSEIEKMKRLQKLGNKAACDISLEEKKEWEKLISIAGSILLKNWNGER